MPVWVSAFLPVYLPAVAVAVANLKEVEATEWLSLQTIAGLSKPKKTFKEPRLVQGIRQRVVIDWRCRVKSKLANIYAYIVVWQSLPHKLSQQHCNYAVCPLLTSVGV